MGMKEDILSNLKGSWKPAVEQQFKEDPEKVKRANAHMNAAELMSNPVVSGAGKLAGITMEDIERILQEIKDEVLTIETIGKEQE